MAQFNFKTTLNPFIGSKSRTKQIIFPALNVCTVKSQVKMNKADSNEKK